MVGEGGGGQLLLVRPSARETVKGKKIHERQLTLWPKKIHSRNLITKKKFLRLENSPLPPPPPPPHNFFTGPSVATYNRGERCVTSLKTAAKETNYYQTFCSQYCRDKRAYRRAGNGFIWLKITNFQGDGRLWWPTRSL